MQKVPAQVPACLMFLVSSLVNVLSGDCLDCRKTYFHHRRSADIGACCDREEDAAPSCLLHLTVLFHTVST